MKLLMILSLIWAAITVSAQTPDTTRPVPDKMKEVMVVEAACGQCKFGLAGDNCDLAIRINGKAYFVDGTAIDDHGDAHGKDGFCNAVRKANVQGVLVDNRFNASYFQLLKEAPVKKGTAGQ